MSNLASTLGDLGQLDEAAKMQKEVLEKRRRILGDEHPDTISAMSNLANTLGELGQLDEAAKMQKEVLEKRRRILKHPAKRRHRRQSIGKKPAENRHQNRQRHPTLIRELFSRPKSSNIICAAPPMPISLACVSYADAEQMLAEVRQSLANGVDLCDPNPATPPRTLLADMHQHQDTALERYAGYGWGSGLVIRPGQ